MMRLLSLLFLVSSCTVLPQSDYGDINQDVHQSFSNANEAVVALFDMRGRLRCSGVWVGDRILTAAHCVLDDNPAIQYSTSGFYDDESNAWSVMFGATLVRKNVDQDVALYSPEGAIPPHRNAFVANEGPYRGQAIYPFGHPYAMGYFYSVGHVVSPIKKGALYPLQLWTLHNAPIYPGMSGGPVFNQDGDIIGLNSFYYQVPGLSGAVHISSIRRILDD